MRGGVLHALEEAMRTLLTEVENNRTNLMVVLAGYKDKMGRLMRAEEGLARRLPNQLNLDDYSPDELTEICERYAIGKHQRPSPLLYKIIPSLLYKTF